VDRPGAWGALIRSACKSRGFSTRLSLCTPRADDRGSGYWLGPTGAFAATVKNDVGRGGDRWSLTTFLSGPLPKERLVVGHRCGPGTSRRAAVSRQRKRAAFSWQ
jgi:hypothetical protein